MPTSEADPISPAPAVVSPYAWVISVLCHLSDEPTPTVDNTHLPERCARLVTQLHHQHRLVARIGIGEPATRPAGLHASYTDAATAVRLGPLVHAADTAVFPISELRPHQLLAETNPRTRDRFLAATLTRLSGESDWPVLRETPHRLGGKRVQPRTRRPPASHPPQQPALPARQGQ